MPMKLSICLVLLTALAARGTVAEENQQNSNAGLSAQVSTGARSKRDSAPPIFSEDNAQAPDDDDPLPPALYDPDVAGTLSLPAKAAVLQALYNLARSEGDPTSFSYSPDGYEDLTADGDDDLDEKRARLFVGKRARLFVGKRPRLFVGKRRLFVGKRQRLFVGKRPRLFVGKRQRVFVGKRPRLFVGKRQRLFVGKRDWQENVQRRLEDFLGQKDEMEGTSSKRAREFVGKRYNLPAGYQTDKRPQRMFIGKRAREFVGKRNYLPADYQTDKRPQRMFVGKRDDVEEMLQRISELNDKRARLFVGKRGHFTSEFPDEEKRLREFVGKRQQEFVSSGDTDDNEDAIDNKRSRMFVGRRSDSAPYELAEKRHSRYFVGKRDSSAFEGDESKDLSSTDEDSLQEQKRAREFVGRR